MSTLTVEHKTPIAEQEYLESEKQSSERQE